MGSIYRISSTLDSLFFKKKDKPVKICNKIRTLHVRKNSPQGLGIELQCSGDVSRNQNSIVFSHCHCLDMNWVIFCQFLTKTVGFILKRVKRSVFFLTPFSSQNLTKIIYLTFPKIYFLFTFPFFIFLFCLTL